MLEYVLNDASRQALAAGNCLIAQGNAKTGPIDKVYAGMYRTASHFHLITHIMTRWDGRVDEQRRMSVLSPFQFLDHLMLCSSGTFNYNGVDYLLNTFETKVCDGDDFIHPSDVLCTILEGKFDAQSTQSEFTERFTDYTARANDLYERFFHEINTPEVILHFSQVDDQDKHDFDCVRNNHSPDSKSKKYRKRENKNDEQLEQSTKEFKRILWENIGGMYAQKREIRQLLDNFYDQDTLRKLGLDPSENGGVFFFGDSGNGKTLAAEAIATELLSKFGSDFVPMFGDYSTFASTLRGGESQSTRKLFDRVRQEAAEGRTILLFLDEMQKMGQREEGAVNRGVCNEVLEQILVETSRFDHSRCILIAASAQDPSTIDPQLLRRGRFGKIIFFDNPTPEESIDIMQRRLNQLASASSYTPYVSEHGIDYQRLATQTQGFTLSDLYHLINDVVSEKRNIIKIGQPFTPFTTEDFEGQIKIAKTKKARARSKVSII